MARRSNGQARKRWQDRLARFATSGLTVEAFCLAEGVSTASYYHWRRRLADEARPSTPTPKPLFQPVALSTAAVLSVQLPGGARLQVPADQLQLARVVVAELAAAAQAVQGGD